MKSIFSFSIILIFIGITVGFAQEIPPVDTVSQEQAIETRTDETPDPVQAPKQAPEQAPAAKKRSSVKDKL